MHTEGEKTLDRKLKIWKYNIDIRKETLKITIATAVRDKQMKV